jgi:hypothetical protein
MTGMKRFVAMFFIASCLSLGVHGQNLVQNPSFENTPHWDSLWVLSFTKPSTRTAVATQVTTDAHEGNSCVELSNTDDGKWTYFFTDVTHAPIRLMAGRSYEVSGWIRSVEEGKEARVALFWNEGRDDEVIYDDTPDPVSQPDWFQVQEIITINRDYNDGYLGLGFKSDKDGDDNVIGKLLFDQLSVTLVPDGTDADIWAFSIPQQVYPAVIDHDQSTISIEVPYYTDITTLAPDRIVVSDGASISPAAGEAQDFTSPVVYTVTAQNGIDTRDWTVTVTVLPVGTATEIISFTLPELVAPATINQLFHVVSGRVAYGTDLSALVPIIGVSPGASIFPASAEAQDFSSPVIYTVTAEDGVTEQDWVVVIQNAPNTETDIIAFEIPELLDPATIDASLHTVTGTVPFGTDLTALVPSIGVSEGAVIDPASGVATDFSSPVLYTVTAQDGLSTQDWTVTVEEAPPRTGTDILLFGIPELTAPATIYQEVHLITGSVLFGTDLTALVPTIEVSGGAAIEPASREPTDFSSPVDYTVTAEDGIHVQHWLVTIQVLPNNETDITGFSLPEQTGVYKIINVDHTVEIEVRAGTDLSSLTPTITLSPGATISPASGVTRDFTNPVGYVVTAQDGLTNQVWTVTVIHEQPSSATDITSFQIPELSAAAVIDHAGHTVEGSVPDGTDLTALVPSIALSHGATIHPESGVATDFSSPVTYRVTAEDGTSYQDWLVSIGFDPAVGTGISETESFRIYPNPATDAIFLELPREADVRLYDLMGKIIYSQDRVRGHMTLHVSEFSRGMYILRLSWVDGSMQQREVVLY